jgi:hypothetical protein
MEEPKCAKFTTLTDRPILAVVRSDIDDPRCTNDRTLQPAP